MSIEKTLEVLQTPEAEGGLTDSDKILAAIRLLEEVQATPAPVSAPVAAPVFEAPAPDAPAFKFASPEELAALSPVAVPAPVVEAAVPAAPTV